jgi:hypothetical protein
MRIGRSDSVNKGNGPPVFRISGELHHLSGALTPSESRLPRYAQLYVYDSQATLDSRMDQNEGLDKGTMGLFMLLDHHQYNMFLRTSRPSKFSEDMIR